MTKYFSLDLCHCGTILNNQASPAIVGGQEAEVNGIPWQVGLALAYWDSFIFCGGTIIGPSTILTAAHCLEQNGVVKNTDSFVVLVAEHDVTKLYQTNRQYVHCVNSVRQAGWEGKILK